MVVGVPRSGSQSKPLRQRYRSLSVVTGERRAGDETPLEARRLPSLADSFRRDGDYSAGDPRFPRTGFWRSRAAMRFTGKHPWLRRRVVP